MNSAQLLIGAWIIIRAGFVLSILTGQAQYFFLLFISFLLIFLLPPSIF